MYRNICRINLIRKWLPFVAITAILFSAPLGVISVTTVSSDRGAPLANLIEGDSWIYSYDNKNVSIIKRTAKDTYFEVELSDQSEFIVNSLNVTLNLRDYNPLVWNSYLLQSKNNTLLSSRISLNDNNNYTYYLNEALEGYNPNSQSSLYSVYSAHEEIKVNGQTYFNFEPENYTSSRVSLDKGGFVINETVTALGNLSLTHNWEIDIEGADDSVGSIYSDAFYFDVDEDGVFNDSVDIDTHIRDDNATVIIRTVTNDDKLSALLSDTAIRNQPQVDFLTTTYTYMVNGEYPLEFAKLSFKRHVVPKGYFSYDNSNLSISTENALNLTTTITLLNQSYANGLSSFIIPTNRDSSGATSPKILPNQDSDRGYIGSGITRNDVLFVENKLFIPEISLAVSTEVDNRIPLLRKPIQLIDSDNDGGRGTGKILPTQLNEPSFNGELVGFSVKGSLLEDTFSLETLITSALDTVLSSALSYYILIMGGVMVCVTVFIVSIRRWNKRRLERI